MGNVTQNIVLSFRGPVQAFRFLERVSICQGVPGTALVYALALMELEKLPFSFSRVIFV